MLRRKSAVSYKHMLITNSDTESDDDVVVVGVKKNNGKGIMVDKDVERNKGKGIMVDKDVERNKGKGIMVDKNVERKKLISAEKEVTKAFNSKACVDHRGPDLVEVAKEYQRYMKKTPIPRGRVPFGVVFNWLGLAKTLKTLYGQPLHYLTFKLCKQWDQSRFGSEDENKPVDAIFQWSSVESTIWKVEEIHRLCTSPYYLAMLWQTDPEYRAFVDEVIPSR